MTVHFCPFCPLRYRWKSELEAHLHEEHQQFHHDYPTAHRDRPDGPDEQYHNDYSPPAL